jgi:hypothetical protein
LLAWLKASLAITSNAIKEGGQVDFEIRRKDVQKTVSLVSAKCVLMTSGDVHTRQRRGRSLLLAVFGLLLALGGLALLALFIGYTLSQDG